MAADGIAACAEAWARGDAAERTKRGAALGLSLDDATAAKVDAALAGANGRRRVNLLGPADVLRAALEALASPHGIATLHAGAGRFDTAKTSLCLAVVRAPKKGAKAGAPAVVVGIGVCWPDRPTPGRVWSEVGPWQQDHARNVEKAAAWAAKAHPDRVAIGVVPRTAAEPAARATRAPSSSGAELLVKILADPSDDQARLVYADWLSEKGDPRGQLIVVQCALGTADKARRKALVAEEKALLRKHGRAWMREAMQVGKECTLSRGFVSRVKAEAGAFVNHGARLFDHDPVEELVLSKPSAAGLRALASAPHVARLSSLRFSSPLYASGAQVPSVREFLASPHVAALRGLAVWIVFDPGAAGLGTLFDGVSWPKLERLFVSIQGAPEAIGSLASAKIPKLRELCVPHGGAAARTALAKAFPGATLSRKTTPD